MILSSRGFTIPGAGHERLAERPADFAAAFTEFVAAICAIPGVR